MKLNATKRSAMERHVISWRQSGLSQRRYCEQAGLGYYGFRYWFYKLTGEDSPQSAFSEIRLPDPAGSSQIEIEYPGGTRLRLHGYFPGSSSNLVKRI